MNADLKQQITKLLTEISGFDYDQMEQKAAKFADQILATGRSGPATVRLVRNLVDELQAWSTDGRLEELPGHHAAQLAANLTSVRDSSKQVSASIDQLPGAGAVLANFHVLCWNYGLRGGPGKEEDLAKSLARIERQFASLDAQALNLTKAQELVPSLEKALATLDKQKDAAKAVLQEINAFRQESDVRSKEILGLKSQLEALLKECDRNAERVRGNTDKVTSSSEKLQQFVSTVDQHRAHMTNQEKRLEEVYADASKRTAEILVKNAALTTEIEQILVLATGASLFKAFGERQRRLTWGRRGWALATVLSTGLTGALIYYLATMANTLDASLIVRSLLSLLGLASIGFCAKQYGRERTLEEEYAFKSTISVSLSAYEKLIADLSADPANAEHRNFVIRSVSQIWAPPVNLEGTASPSTPVDFQKATRVLREVSKAVAPFVRK